MFKWLKSRLAEPTTYLGVGLFAQSVMVLTKSDPAHTTLVSDAIQSAAEPLASGDYTSALTIGVTGLLGILIGEKSR